MKTSDTLYAARDYIREHGFTFDLEHGCMRCMLGAIDAVGGDYALERPERIALERVTDLGFGGYGPQELRDCGWTANDACAALEIAADIAAADGN